MPWYIHTNGRDVSQWSIYPGGVELDSGEVIPDGDFERRIFAVHPDNNARLEQVAGVWHYNGHTLEVAP